MGIWKKIRGGSRSAQLEKTLGIKKGGTRIVKNLRNKVRANLIAHNVDQNDSSSKRKAQERAAKKTADALMRGINDKLRYCTTAEKEKTKAMLSREDALVDIMSQGAGLRTLSDQRLEESASRAAQRNESAQAIGYFATGLAVAVPTAGLFSIPFMFGSFLAGDIAAGAKRRADKHQKKANLAAQDIFTHMENQYNQRIRLS